MGEGAAEVLSESGADLTGERAGCLRQGLERLGGVGQPEGLQLCGVSVGVLTKQDEVAGVGDEDEPILLPVAADLIALGGEPSVVVGRLDLDHAALGELALAGLSARNLPGGVESEVGMSGALLGKLADAEDFGSERVADVVQQVGQRTVGGAFAGGSAGSANASEVGEVVFDDGGQLGCGGWHGRILESSGRFAKRPLRVGC